MNTSKMDTKQLRSMIEGLTDGEYIGLLDTVCGVEYGLTATEWIEHEYSVGKPATIEAINEMRPDDSEQVEVEFISTANSRN